MLTKACTSIGIPASIRVALGQGDSWGADRLWYSAPAAAVNSSTSVYMLADMNDDELADVVVLDPTGTGVDVYVIYSNGTAFSPPAGAASAWPTAVQVLGAASVPQPEVKLRRRLLALAAFNADGAATASGPSDHHHHHEEASAQKCICAA